MKKNLLIALSAIALLTLNACNKASKTGLLVPKEAALVIHLNLGSLSSKVSWEEIQKADWYQDLGKEAPDTVTKRLLEDPASSGLDTKGDQLFIVAQENPGGYFAWVGGIKDEAAFSATVTKLNKGTEAVTKDGEYSVLATKESILLWNKSHAVAIGNTDLSKAAAKAGWGQSERHQFSADSLKYFAKRILNLEGSDLLDNDKRFANLMKETGDVHFWINSERIASNSLGGMAGMMKLNVLVENNVTTATLDFENGKIRVKANQYFGPELTDLVKKYPPKEISKDVWKHLPSENVIAAGAFNYPPDGVKALLKLTGVDGLANGFIGKMGYSIDEFVKANKGDITFAVSDFKIKQDTSSYYDDYSGKRIVLNNDKPSFNFIAGVSINDKQAFDKLVGIIVAESSKMPTDKISYKLDNNWFVAGNDAQQVSSFLTNNNTPGYASRISGHAAGAFVDIATIIKTTMTVPVDTVASPWKARERKMLELSAGFWSDAQFTSDVKDGRFVYDFEINLVDKGTNSLKQIVRYAAQMSELTPKQTAKTDYPDVMEGPIDSAVAVPEK